MQPSSQLKDEEMESEQPKKKKKKQNWLGISPWWKASIRLLGFLKWKYFTLAELATKLHTV